MEPWKEVYGPYYHNEATGEIRLDKPDSIIKLTNDFCITFSGDVVHITRYMKSITMSGAQWRKLRDEATRITAAEPDGRLQIDLGYYLIVTKELYRGKTLIHIRECIQGIHTKKGVALTNKQWGLLARYITGTPELPSYEFMNWNTNEWKIGSTNDWKTNDRSVLQDWMIDEITNEQLKTLKFYLINSECLFRRYINIDNIPELIEAVCTSTSDGVSKLQDAMKSCGFIL